jgi:hypothetical protein
MRKFIAAALASALILPIASASAKDGAARRAEAAAKAEAKLAKMLDGRVAGKPQDCIFLPSIRSSRIIDKTAIVYEAGGTLYVNRPRNGASSLDDDDILVTDLHGSGSQLCSIDVVRLHDRTSFFYSGFVSLGEFVPYKRVRQASN